MVRPFAEAEEQDKIRRERKEIEQKEAAEFERKRKERQILEERERRANLENMESQPKPVKMVRPFAEAEEQDKIRRERKEIDNNFKLIDNLLPKKEANNLNAKPETNVQNTSKITPDQLNITIRTSIPGYQKIEYNPSMTIKDIDSKGVQFNALIKLNKTIVDKIPSEYRTKQFFDKGLFNSLLNYNGRNEARSLLQATHLGYIDNNIKVTLDSIFPVNSVIYIGKKPYAIGDVQWTNGDWKIEVKQKKEEI